MYKKCLKHTSNDGHIKSKIEVTWEKLSEIWYVMK